VRSRRFVALFVVLLVSTVVLTLPASATGPTIVNFSADPVVGDQVTLHWDTTDAAATYVPVYIYGPRIGDNGSPHDVGFLTADGNLTFRVPPGKHRYTLSVVGTGNPAPSATRQLDIEVSHPAPVVVTTPDPSFVDRFNLPASIPVGWTRTSGTYAVVRNGPTAVWWGTGSSYAVPQANVASDGAHSFSVEACTGAVPPMTQSLPAGALCSERNIFNIVTGGSRFAGTYRRFLTPNTNATVSWNVPASGYSWKLDAPTLGVNGLSVSAISFTFNNVPAGLHVVTLQSCFTGVGCAGATDRIELVAGSTWGAARDWKTDFDPATSRYVEMEPNYFTGRLIDATVDGAGSTWVSGEASQGIGKVVDTSATIFEAPLARDTQYPYTSTNQLAYDKVRPFSFNGPSWLASSQSIVTGGGKIWFSQTGNYSRIVSFDPTGTDDQATATDERFCAYTVPGSPSNVEGVAWDPGRNRVWYTDGQPGSSSLNSFAPSELACENFIDYSQPNPLSASTHHYCPTDGVAAVGCMQHIDLTAKGWGSAAHVIVDSSGNNIWFAGGLWENSLGQYSPSANHVYKYPLPTKTGIGGGPFSPGAYPWQIRQQGNLVYLTEFWDASIIRFDKAAVISGFCNALVNGQNPCMNELYLPIESSNQHAHSIEIQNNKLWWTASNPGQAAFADTSTIGYVDLTNFTPGAWYSGLTTDLVAPSRRSLMSASYAGLGVEPSGALDFVDSNRREEIRLVPR
jgi:hypothetical protein